MNRPRQSFAAADPAQADFRAQPLDLSQLYSFFRLKSSAAPFIMVLGELLATRKAALFIQSWHSQSCVPSFQSPCEAPNISAPRRAPVMAKAQRDFTDILVKKGIVSSDQIEEARALANSTG